MSGRFLVALRSLLALLLAGAVTAQISCSAIADSFAADGFASAVLAALVVSGGLCVEAVLLGVWMLAGMARDERLFDDRPHADRWVNLAIGSLAAGAGFALIALVCFAIAVATQPAPLGWGLMMLAAVSAGVSAALALVVVVMRRLLHAAIALQSELADVI